MRLSLVIILIVNILFGCSEPERILSGKRVDPDSSFGFYDQDKNSLAKDNRIELPPMKANKEWAVISSAISKDHPNLMLSENPSELWATSIGKGDSKKKRLVTDPIFYKQMIFTLDANSIASAFDTKGKLLWKKDLTPPGEKSGEIFGGGFTTGQDQLFVTLGMDFCFP